jgi:hypothetical protein
VSGQHHAPAALYPRRKSPPYPAGWAPEPVWTQRLEEKSSASVGERTPAVQFVVRHYIDWATRLTGILERRINLKCVVSYLICVVQCCRRYNSVFFVTAKEMLIRRQDQISSSRKGGVRTLNTSFSYFTASFRRPFEMRLGATGLIRLWSNHLTETPTHCCHTTKEAVLLRFPSLCTRTMKLNCPQGWVTLSAFNLVTADGYSRHLFLERL